MPLYVPRHFEPPSPDLGLEIVDAHPFATLITCAEELWVSHIPLLRHGEHIVGHLARANPHSQAVFVAPSLAIFQGPHAYISPTWYATPSQVPTWNYAVVHIFGIAEPTTSDESVAALQEIVSRFDSEVALDLAQIERQAHGIVAFRMPMERVDVKFKLSQNKQEQDRLNVVEALLDRDGPDDRAVAEWMRRLSKLES